MRCPSCGTENRPGAQFCRECAKPLVAEQPGAAQSCPNCGAPAQPGTRFCNTCGTPLMQVGPVPVARPEPPPPPAWSAPPVMPPPEEPRRGMGGCTWVLVIGGILGGLLLCVAIVVGVVFATQGGIPGLFPSPVPTATATPVPTDTPLPTNTPVPPTDTPIPTSTNTPLPTAVPTKTPPPTLTFTPPPPSVFPQECDQAEATADYGPIGPGSVVILGRHREVNGDDNWAADMDAFVGEEASVSRLSGVDGQGCPGIRVDIDGEAWFWRVRDLALVSAFPQECGMTDEDAVYGPLDVGFVVILGRHRQVNGDDNWAADMDAFVGEQTSVDSLAGVDGQGCPGIRVEIDGGAWFWRIRDLSLPY